MKPIKKRKWAITHHDWDEIRMTYGYIEVHGWFKRIPGDQKHHWRRPIKESLLVAAAPDMLGVLVDLRDSGTLNLNQMAKVCAVIEAATKNK
jgi:hypothetical protein